MQKRTLYQSGKFYKGNLHTHTTRSDGSGEPWEVTERYRQEGYSFLAITDHWVYGVHEALNREDFLIFPGTELDLEMPERKDHHLVSIGLPETNRIPDDYRFEEERTGNTLCTPQRILEYMAQRGNVTIYAHPYWSKVDSTDIKDIHGLLGMEIYNHVAEFEDSNGNSETYYDHFLFVRNRTYCFASDDTHELGPHSLGGFIMAKARELTHRGIFEALRDGSFYASSGPLIHDFYVEDGAACALCSGCTDIYFKTPHRSGHLHDDQGNLESGTFVLNGDEEYVRLVVKNAAGEKAWSQPIWLWLL